MNSYSTALPTPFDASARTAAAAAATTANTAPPLRRAKAATTTTTSLLDRSAMARLWLVFACALVLAVGFARAATYHIAAVNFGYQQEQLRREQAALLDEQKQLQLALSQITAPQKLEQSARTLGLVPARAAQISSMQSGSTPIVALQK